MLLVYAHAKVVTLCDADAGAQQRDVKKEKEGAMHTIMQDGMRVTAANRQAWIEICTCPLSLVCPDKPGAADISPPLLIATLIRMDCAADDACFPSGLARCACTCNLLRVNCCT